MVVAFTNHCRQKSGLKFLRIPPTKRVISPSASQRPSHNDKMTSRMRAAGSFFLLRSGMATDSRATNAVGTSSALWGEFSGPWGESGALGGALGGVSGRLGGLLSHPVTRPASLVLLGQQPIAHQRSKDIGDAFRMLAGDLLQAAIGHTAFHLRGYYRLHCRLVQPRELLAKALLQRLFHIRRNQADHRQHHLHAVGLQGLLDLGRAPVLGTPPRADLVHARARLLATTDDLDVGSGPKTAQIGRFEFVDGFVTVALAMTSALGRGPVGIPVE